MTFGKVIFDRELTFGEGKLKNYIKQKLAIFTALPTFSAEIAYKKVRFPQYIEYSNSSSKPFGKRHFCNLVHREMCGVLTAKYINQQDHPHHLRKSYIKK